MLIIATLIKNEIDKIPEIDAWLEPLLSDNDTNVQAVFVDNGSTDGTLEAIDSIREQYPAKCHLASSTENFEVNEQKLRSKLWEEIKKLEPTEADWVLILDADEVPSPSVIDLIKALATGMEGERRYNIEPHTMLITLRLKELWQGQRYRIDGQWSPYFNRLFRFYDAPFTTEHKQGLHTNPLPEYLLNLPVSQCLEVDIFHTGYNSGPRRQAKTKRYLEHNKRAVEIQHAQSILAPPSLKEIDDSLPTFAICSLVHDRRWALKHYLYCLSNLPAPIGTHVYFLANNCDPETMAMLFAFRQKNPNYIVNIEVYNFELIKASRNHDWPDDLLAQMSHMRNKCLEYGQKYGLEAIISIDTDLVFDWKVINHLLRCDKDIISPVFWASWKAKDGYGRRLPQVWRRGGGEIDDQFLQWLKERKCLTRVGGLGAFTKISSRVWEAGVNYDPVYNLASNIRGEDRHFCIRAAVAGFQLWASTYHKVYHLDNKDILSQYQAIGLPFLAPE